MSTDANKPTSGSPLPPSRNAALFVLGTILDTTWRVFLPVLLGVGIGIWLDHAMGAKPAATITGTTLGALAAAGLIYQQIKQGVKAS